ncbi:extracellular solute-binding protein [Paenibacillus sp. PR3]|uniref:Extracellular solute-binding protein n=1 Tax=Paenibacillus terricola TaxID=2763503 RepID=A0ABR8MN29_9BACL|nr:extracellular solute-binding protein [Paenibacillus terricola]MBD3917424.1 extracellular solute-binding protein [Paenibacillus terricola]
MKRNAIARKRLTATFLVGTLVASSLAACGSSSDDDKKESTTQQTETASTGTDANTATTPDTPKQQDPLKLDIMLPIFKTNFPKDDSPVAAQIEKLTNTDIHFLWVPNASYTDKLNITLASGKLPSIIYIDNAKGASFVNAAKSGAFWELSSYLKDYKFLSQANSVILNNSSVEGKTYGIYRSRNLGRNGIVYRKDWLENVGLSEPKTIDDFYNMLKAFKEKDPDKNGKDDTYGMVLVKWTGGWASGFDTMKLWFGSPNKWGVQDGKLVPEFETTGYMDALRFMKKLYDEKLINQDFAVYDSAKWVDPVVNNKAGVIVDVVDTAARIDDKIHAALKEAGTEVPDDQNYMDVVGGVIGSDGTLHTLPTSGFAGLLSIPKSSVKTEDELKRVLGFIDQLSEPELQTLASFGIEGTHYTKNGEFAEPSKDSVLLESEVEGLNQMLTFIPSTTAITVKQTPLRLKQTALMKENEQYIVPNPAEPFISTVYSQKGPQLDDIINDARIKYIVGQIDEAGFLAAIELWKKTGGNDLVEEMNQLYAASNK